MLPERIVPFGDAAFLVVLGDQPDPAVNARVHALAEALRAAHLPGVVSLVPAYVSLLVDVDPLVARPAAIRAAIRRHLARLDAAPPSHARHRTIPVVYGGEHGRDLEEVARLTGRAPEDVVAAHAGAEQVVYMLGFAPGHPYLGDLPADLALPRLASPRALVPRGSVAIAGRQTVIYSQAMPGGWRLLGRTPVDLWDARRDPPAYLAPGDHVRFVPVPAADWDRLAGPPADW